MPCRIGGANIENMKSLKQILAIIVLSITTQSIAQQEAHFTQYMDNTLFVNPAYAGSKGMLNATAIHREQWVGMDGRPRSTTFSLHSPLSYENIGLGITAVHDIVGPIQSTMVYGNFSYSLNFKNSPGKLAFGVNGGVNIINSKTDLLSTTQVNDPDLLAAAGTKVLPNFGGGIYYHTPKWFVGLSTPKLLESSIDETSTSIEQRHYFFIVGGVFNLNSTWKLRPTSQLKYTIGSPLSIDLSAALIYNKKVWFGLMYRWEDSFGAFVQYQVSPQFKAGIAYDHTATRLSGYNHGTFEVLLSYDFVFKKTGIRSPRYF